ncbi:hypothetical protein FUA26_02800 [Seonamhaeicola algicola]|uniref:Aspartyl-tRNA synthetase n=1 Tax=Seonamhaeicola algicola TaxID=1719036 RepID=A0A5C7AYK9_9FLAO|nr:DUF6503 family protein [Seonamhaeicola algicola]TXE12743.1 hypothetical protein FUA26_02800 [Seonamhaeicola algicola]
MKFYLLLFSCLCALNNAISQQITATELLEKSIAFHDPQNKWPTFKGNFVITMETPNKSPRVSAVLIDLEKEYFQVTATKDTITTRFTIDKNNCSFALNNSENISEENMKKHNLNCERATLYKNYYTYLYGLPMKLKDPGTNINPTVEKKQFKGKTYLVLKANYDKTVGTDVWHFYFNPKTYAMEAYQFYKTNNDGTVKKDSGEYILLTDLKTINGVKMPKNRAWYYNKNNKLLGTDILY